MNDRHRRGARKTAEIKPVGNGSDARKTTGSKVVGRQNEATKAMRLLEMFEYLRKRGLFASDGYGEGQSLPLHEVAEHFSYSLKDTYDIISLLSCCRQNDYLYVPVYCDEDYADKDCRVHGDRFESLDKPLRLSSAETTALVCALGLAGIPPEHALCRKLADAASGDTAEAHGAAGMGDAATADDAAGMGDAAEAVSGTTGDATTAVGDNMPSSSKTASAEEEQTLPRLLYAIDEHEVVTFLYPAKDGSGVERRTVEPLQVQTDRGRWYLHAWCRTREGIRTFLIERMDDLVVTDEVFSPHVDKIEGLAEILSGDVPDAHLRFEAGFHIDYRDWPGIHIDEENPDGSRITAIPYVDGSQWLPTRIASCLGAVRAIDPPELVRATHDLAMKHLEDSRQFPRAAFRKDE